MVNLPTGEGTGVMDRIIVAMGGTALGLITDFFMERLAIQFDILQTAIYKTLHVDDVLGILLLILGAYMTKGKLRTICIIAAGTLIGIEGYEMLHQGATVT